MATRSEPTEALGAPEPEIAVSVAPAASAVPTSTTDTVAIQRFIRADKATVHCRGRADDTLGSSAGAVRQTFYNLGRLTDPRSSAALQAGNCADSALANIGQVSSVIHPVLS
jgi:hypothetical protein